MNTAKRVLYWVSRIYPFLFFPMMEIISPSEPSALFDGITFGSLGISMLVLVITSPPLSKDIRIFRWIVGITTILTVLFVLFNLNRPDEVFGLVIATLFLGGIIAIETIALLIAETVALYKVRKNQI